MARSTIAMLRSLDQVLAGAAENGDLTQEALDSFTGYYAECPIGTRAAVRGTLDRKTREAFESSSMPKARACVQLRDAIIKVMT